jgi:hypothetical protein
MRWFLESRSRAHFRHRQVRLAEQAVRLIPSKFWAIGLGHKLRLTVKSVESASLQPVAHGSVVTVATGSDASFVTLNLWKP